MKATCEEVKWTKKLIEMQQSAQLLDLFLPVSAFIPPPPSPPHLPPPFSSPKSTSLFKVLWLKMYISRRSDQANVTTEVNCLLLSWWVRNNFSLFLSAMIYEPAHFLHKWFSSKIKRCRIQIDADGTGIVQDFTNASVATADWGDKVVRDLTEVWKMSLELWTRDPCWKKL